jgi:hypothetical protein
VIQRRADQAAGAVERAEALARLDQRQGPRPGGGAALRAERPDGQVSVLLAVVIRGERADRQVLAQSSFSMISSDTE